jgi:hypothetical protein
MKWLALFLSVLAMPALADNHTQTQGVTILPIPTPCGNIPLDELYLEKYGEIPFLEGDGSIVVGPDQAVNGIVEMYVNPETKSFTIVFNINDKLYCMLTSGKDLKPFVKGTKL